MYSFEKTVNKEFGGYGVVGIDESKRFTPDVVTFNTMISGLCKRGRQRKQMVVGVDGSRGLQPDVVTFNTMVNGLCREGRWRKLMGCWN
ncbi:pentatricopeptide repeat-containing protein At5g16640, mitochondrial-like [Pistacia vera]|uniref:pentatricopeptide repeat-containing protein At5g16640, mitochondrial-like n=1 Tax=Pistacia vera TaxID=55513 RepID=UPI0012637B40|nr:pentatricopeptide repeat-containing protein At5g16640, mitochondrial-like [Pistacia vera]